MEEKETGRLTYHERRTKPITVPQIPAENATPAVIPMSAEFAANALIDILGDAVVVEVTDDEDVNEDVDVAEDVELDVCVLDADDVIVADEEDEDVVVAVADAVAEAVGSNPYT